MAQLKVNWQNIVDCSDRFWKTYPALFFALHLLLGTAYAYRPDPFLILPLLVLWISYRRFYRLFLGLILTVTACLYATHLNSFPVLKDHRSDGVAYFSISTLKPHSSPFHKSLLYKGTIKTFASKEGQHFHNIPCFIYTPKSSKRPLANCDYVIHGSLCQKGPFIYVLKPDKKKPWQPVEKTFSSAEWRYQAQDSVKQHLAERIPDKQARTFLLSMLTGEIEERLLSFQFGKLGMQHILGVSGFQFALFAVLLSWLLRRFLPRAIAACILLLLLSAYFLFLGDSPPVQRGWIAILVVIVGDLLGRKTTALNALGVGLICALMLDPLVITNIGFQLSFLCTAGILCLYKSCETLFEKLLPKRPLGDLIEMSRFQQHGYIASALIRKSLALNIAVHLCALPAVLFLFHKFPLLSLAYNLFFPFWAGISFLLLLISLPISLLIPPLGLWLHHLNSSFTSTLLQLVIHPPAILDFYIRTKTFPFPLLITLLTAILFTGFYCKAYKLTKGTH
jgi:competence protein ComEC